MADAELVPHARNRVDASSVLGVNEEMLWPQAVKDRVKTGTDREIVQTYPYRSACPSTTWGELISGAAEEVFFAGYTNYFLWLEQPNFAATLVEKMKAGVRVRFLLGDPDAEVTRSRERVENVALSVSTRIRITLENVQKIGSHERLEVRCSAPDDAAGHIALSVFRFDRDALVTPHLARLVGHDSPLIHLRKAMDGCMFDRFADHAEELWSAAVPLAETHSS
ncbi:XRE family transcriptional regulator [Actinacidiphila sp. DG2A-62]|uniref:XRE family transcriptional regulator n=1 Tax=Actinacidiphila sp. DG2A-62 TaxID=3108821 RepID=UPI002DB9C870|nr:XRE family transcriptional regulator [Actinacidiphila sp. DG2A-62]MEC3993844.1 XRE family transcriptional regulator [Actinacidiphila sp. DG2A-62]